MTIYNPHNRMREMFKPSMAELGLCMYQVSGCTYHHGDVRETAKVHPRVVERTGVLVRVETIGKSSDSLKESSM